MPQDVLAETKRCGECGRPSTKLYCGSTCKSRAHRRQQGGAIPEAMLKAADHDAKLVGQLERLWAARRSEDPKRWPSSSPRPTPSWPAATARTSTPPGATSLASARF